MVKMIAEVLAVGTELLMGQIANTNAQYISSRLPDVGIGVYYHSVVGDNPKRLKECLDIALKRSDIVIMTGGLGPTQDDLTKETVAQMLGRKLVLHQESYERIKAYFEKIGREMAESNAKQAYLPENSIIILNDNGTAPGCIIEEGNKVVVMLPGPPSEMKPMFENSVIPYFKKKLDYKLKSCFIKIFGIGESSVEQKLIDLIDGQVNPTLATYAKYGEVTLRITASCPKDEEPDSLIKPVAEKVAERMGDALYSYDGEELYQVAAKKLMENNITVAFAESCTGGLISAKFTEIPGVSKIFNRTVVCYSNQSKMEDLGVKEETLVKFGAVSRETAEEMASGIRKHSGTDIGVSVTGIAGPGGGTDEKPVGLVYIALDDGERIQSKELRLWGSRNRIRNLTSMHVFNMIRLWADEKQNGKKK